MAFFRKLAITSLLLCAGLAQLPAIAQSIPANETGVTADVLLACIQEVEAVSLSNEPSDLAAQVRDINVDAKIVSDRSKRFTTNDRLARQKI